MALNGGAILQWMLGQAMLYARGLAPPNHWYLEDPYPPLNRGEAQRCSQRLWTKSQYIVTYWGDWYKPTVGKPWHMRRGSELTWRVWNTVPTIYLDEYDNEQKTERRTPLPLLSSSKNQWGVLMVGRLPVVDPWNQPPPVLRGKPLQALSSADGGSQDVRPPANQGGEEQTGGINSVILVEDTPAPEGYTTRKGKWSISQPTASHPQGQTKSGGGM